MNAKNIPAEAPECVQETVHLQDVTLRDDERQPCEVWTRVMGYHRPTTSFNPGKQGEFAERKYFREGCTRHGETNE
ncbi:MAG: anaerobic ribonucleoside-triphosphate reductase [Acidithiobacillus sp.]